MRIARYFTALSLFSPVVALGLFTTVGCDNKETVLDVETPSGQVEVERDRTTGEVDVEATDNE